MNWQVRERNGRSGTRPGRSSRSAAFGLAAVVALVTAAAPAAAQMRGGFGGGGGFSPGRVVGPGSDGGGSVWSGRPRFPGLGINVPRFMPQPRYDDDDEVPIVRERPPAVRPARVAEPKPRPTRVAEPKGRPARVAEPKVRPARMAEPKARPATKIPARQAAIPARPRVQQPPPTPRPPRQNASAERYAPGEVVVEFQRGTTQAVTDEVARSYGLTRIAAQPVSLLDTTLHRFRIRNGRPVEAVVNRLAGDARIASAQPNFVFRLQGEAPGGMAGLQYAPAKLRLPEAQQIASGDGVTVAIIDSAIDPDHPELAGAISRNLSALGASGKADPHGTAIAGIVAARAKLVGAAPAVRLVAIEAFAKDARSGETRSLSTDIVQAISLASEAGVRLANLSFAGPSDPLLSRAIAAAKQRGTIFVAAAGNAGPKAPPSYPAADPNVIGVTATNQRDGLFASANRGAYIAVAAPGVDVLVAAPGKGYKVSTGTSMAAAHVTGVLALVLQTKPDITFEEARRILVDSAKDLGPAGPDPEFGAGLVDARRALERASEVPPPDSKVVATVPAGE